MAPHGGGLRAVPVLVALIAVLLPAGAFAAAAVDAGQPPPGTARVGAAGLSGEPLADDQPRPLAPTASLTSTVAPAPPVTVTTPKAPAQTSTSTPTTPRRTATTTAAPATPMFPTPPGFPPLPMPTFPPNPSASAWSKTADGITVRMHIEPSMPIPGQPVRFVIDEVTAPVTCCIIHLLPESGTPTVPFQGSHGPNPEIGICGSPPATRSGLSHTHTYAEPGVYAVGLMVITSACQMPAVGGPSVPPTNRLLHLPACITVGPELIARSLPVPPACAGS